MDEGPSPGLLAMDGDTGFGPVALYFRHVVRERLQVLFRPGTRVLDLGCGAGDDALFLGGLGVFVLAVDSSPAMIERARRQAEASHVSEKQVRFEVRAVEEGAGGEVFDGAYSTSTFLSSVDLSGVGWSLASSLRPLSPVLLSFAGRSPLPARLRRALRGREGCGRQASSHGPAEVRRLLGDSFLWRGCFGLGLLVPGSDRSGWACRHPETFGMLAGLERILRAWPGLRALGDRFVLEGLRR